ncbi:PREDICTED: secretion-regulating guanine nucleotide exchange factor isoform X7 [Myotis brandtii]|uniref:secretion-regulating guanine nucleotide exchange factor isoform X7 n=1 Tax=Myotis brandtii TaxID=109478 RepID=UPI00070433E5|nr:PREDICTED: secretion-regulating guanine nucleotide exchange factor isoform X7 [Myotis brandtii]
MAPKTEDRLSPSLWVTGAPHPAWPGGRGRPQPRPSLAGASFPVRPAECGGAQRQRPCTVAAVLLWPAPARVGGAGGCAGANSYGQLGLGHKEDVFLPQQLNDFCKPVCVRRIAGGGGHSAVVTDGGSLFVCGLNKDGQLGLGHTEDVLYFTPCKSLIGCPIQQVACGWDFTIILTENGQVLSCGSNSFGQLGVPHGPGRCVVPQAIELLREEVVSIAAGLRHALAATASGIVFQWGTGLASSGRRLCPGQTLPLFLTAKEPSRVPETGKVFTWGRADYGQLGRKLESEEGWRPEKQGSPLPCSRPWESTPSSLHCLTGATEISCGSEHNLAVIGGACYSWGWNEQGMCGDGSEADVQAPKPVQALQSSPGLLVGCGAGHSLALCQLPALPSPDASEDAKSQEATDKATGRKDNQDHLPKATLTGAEIGGL